MTNQHLMALAPVAGANAQQNQPGVVEAKINNSGINKKPSHVGTRTCSKTMKRYYMLFIGCMGEISYLKTVCNRAQKQLMNFNCEGEWVCREDFSRDGKEIKQGQRALCISMTGTSHINELLSGYCNSMRQDITALYCQPVEVHEEGNGFDVPMEETTMLKFMNHAIKGEDQPDFMEWMFKYAMKMDASFKFYISKFFEQNDHAWEALELIASAAQDNYTPAIDTMKYVANLIK